MFFFILLGTVLILFGSFISFSFLKTTRTELEKYLIQRCKDATTRLSEKYKLDRIGMKRIGLAALVLGCLLLLVGLLAMTP